MASLKTSSLKLGFLQMLLALLVALLGITVVLGWLLQVSIMVEIGPGLVGMVFNTALCFALCGTALALPDFLKTPLPRLQAVTGALVFILCALSFTEQLFDISLGIDSASLHLWLGDGNTRPGRMAPNTALGFMLIGASLILSNRINSKGRALALQILTFCVLTIGVTGLIGYTLGPDLLFGWARSARMALHTGCGMVVTSLVLWLSWYRSEWFRLRTYFAEDENISFMAAAILAVITISACLMGFVLQQPILEGSLKEKLQTTLNSRLVLLQSVTQLGIEKANQATHHAEQKSGQASDTTELAFLLAQSSAMATNTPLARQLQQMLNTLVLANGFQAAALTDADGKNLATVGNFSLHYDASIALPGPTPAKILWDQQFYLQTETPLIDNGVKTGTLTALQALPALHERFFSTSELGSTGEIALCKAEVEKLLCFPNLKNTNFFTVNRVSAVGKLLPMSYAVTGKSGIMSSMDYKKQNVIAAFSPLAPGVGLVVKQETMELYAPIRQQLKFMGPALLVLVTVGIFLLRSLLTPLVTRVIASENRATEKELEIKAVVGNVGEGIITIDQHGTIESFNAAASKIFGYEVDEMLGRKLKILMPPEMRDPHERGMHRYLSGGAAHVIGRQGVELPGLRKDGTIFLLELTVTSIQIDQRRLFVGIVRDITERKQLQDKLAFMAQYDSLTGLPNRALFMDRLSGALARANRNHSALAVMFLDLDGFKNINDTLGHQKGDDLLAQFGGRLKIAVRASDTVARLGGDEYTIILESMHDTEQDIQVVANKIIDAMQEPFALEENTVLVTTSIGIAIHVAGEANPDELLRRADNAMYSAKKSGKNRWCVAAQAA